MLFYDVFSFDKTLKSKKSLNLSDVLKQPSNKAENKATGAADTLMSSQSDDKDDGKIL